MEASPTRHAVTDLDGRFLGFDRRYCGILDYGRDELLSLSLRQVTHPDDLARNVALLRRLCPPTSPSPSGSATCAATARSCGWRTTFPC